MRFLVQGEIAPKHSCTARQQITDIFLQLIKKIFTYSCGWIGCLLLIGCQIQRMPIFCGVCVCVCVEGWGMGSVVKGGVGCSLRTFFLTKPGLLHII